ncbi:hypothetical protein [Geopseudomonas aromaticivorans]
MKHLLVALTISICLTSGVAQAQEKQLLFIDEVGGPYTDEWSGSVDTETKGQSLIQVSLYRTGKSGDLLASVVLDCTSESVHFAPGIEFGDFVVSAEELANEVPEPVLTHAREAFCGNGAGWPRTAVLKQSGNR